VHRSVYTSGMEKNPLDFGDIAHEVAFFCPCASVPSSDL
jgi:hypothetical protein